MNGITHFSRRLFHSLIFPFALVVSHYSACGQNVFATNSLSVGLCTAELETAKMLGFEFAELSVRDFVKLSDAEFAAFTNRCYSNGLPVLRGYLFIPGTLKVVGPEVQTNALMAYFEKAFSRSEQLGIRMIAWGSGDSRSVPAGFSRAKAFEQLVVFAKILAPEARKHGILLLAEPLRREECNIINSAAEALQWVQAVNDPNFEMLVDIFHMRAEHEDYAVIIQAGAHIRHLHFSNPEGRRFPLRTNEFDYQPFFRALRQINYHGTLSIEGRTDHLTDEGPRAIELVKTACAVAKK